MGEQTGRKKCLKSGSEKKTSSNSNDVPKRQPCSKVDSAETIWPYDKTIQSKGILSAGSPATTTPGSWIKNGSPACPPSPLRCGPSSSRHPMLDSIFFSKDLNATMGFPQRKVDYPLQDPLPKLSSTGKRPAGIGTEIKKQGVIDVNTTNKGVSLRVTLLAAGYVIGPNGASIHQIENISKAEIYSYNRSGDAKVARPSRQFHIEGPREAVNLAAHTICHAIAHYKSLAEGHHQGMVVKRLHKINGVLFRYEPPPRSKVPSAAQVEYDEAELRILRSMTGPNSLKALTRVRKQLARRDEAHMRANLEPPVTKNILIIRGKSNPESDLGEPDCQDNNIKQKLLIDMYDDLSWILSMSPKKRSSILNERFHEMVNSSRKSSLDGKSDEDCQANVRTEGSVTQQGNARLGYPGNSLEDDKGSASTKQAKAPQENQPEKWRKKGGLHGVDFFLPKKDT